jgi:hypothetical protein
MTTSVVCCSLDCSPDVHDGVVAHRLQKQSGPGTKVPGRKMPKFVDSTGTKVRRGHEIRPENAPG